MKPAAFIRHVPKTLDEAVKILAEVAPQDGRVLAGGQSLVPIMAFRLAKPAHLVDINEVAGLDKVSSDGKTLGIGARVRHAAFHKPAVDGPLGALLTHVVRHIAHYPIRMRGTFCGSLAHADPASEWCLVVATLDATMIAASTRGERRIAAKEFFAGIMSTALADDELLARVELPLLPAGTTFGFNEFSRRAGDFAMSASLVTYRLDGGKDDDTYAFEVFDDALGTAGMIVPGPGFDTLDRGDALAGFSFSVAGCRCVEQVLGSAFDDVIDARDGVAETVACGGGTDQVLADRRDRVARDCESVTRSPG